MHRLHSHTRTNTDGTNWKWRRKTTKLSAKTIDSARLSLVNWLCTYQPHHGVSHFIDNIALIWWPLSRQRSVLGQNADTVYAHHSSKMTYYSVHFAGLLSSRSPTDGMCCAVTRPVHPVNSICSIGVYSPGFKLKHKQCWCCNSHLLGSRVRSDLIGKWHSVDIRDSRHTRVQQDHLKVLKWVKGRLRKAKKIGWKMQCGIGIWDHTHLFNEKSSALFGALWEALKGPQPTKSIGRTVLVCFARVYMLCVCKVQIHIPSWRRVSVALFSSSLALWLFQRVVEGAALLTPGRGSPPAPWRLQASFHDVK